MIEFIEDRLAQMFARPGMWGHGESFELQVLLLVEMHCVASGKASTAVLARYQNFGRSYGHRGSLMLSGWIEQSEQRPELLIEILRAWVESELPGFVFNRLA